MMVLMSRRCFRPCPVSGEFHGIVVAVVVVVVVAIAVAVAVAVQN